MANEDPFGDYGDIEELLNECKSGFKTSTIKADYMIVTVFLERAENNFEFRKCVPLIKMNCDKLCSMVYFLFFRTKLLIMTVLLFSLKSTGQSISLIGRVPIEILPGKRHIT